MLLGFLQSRKTMGRDTFVTDDEMTKQQLLNWLCQNDVNTISKIVVVILLSLPCVYKYALFIDLVRV